MAYYIVNDNGKAPSSAKVGDIIVTGGGLYEKTATGSVRRQDLEDSTGYSTTGSYKSVVDTYNRITGKSSGGSSGSTTTTNDPTPGPAGTTNVTTETIPDSAGGTNLNVGYDVNGIGNITGFNPNSYGTSSGGISTDTSNTVKNVLGYLILGIIGLVLLDRALGK